MVKGINYLLIEIENSDEVQAIRIDPVNVETECVIENIEFYEFYSE